MALCHVAERAKKYMYFDSYTCELNCESLSLDHIETNRVSKGNDDSKK